MTTQEFEFFRILKRIIERIESNCSINNQQERMALPSFLVEEMELKFLFAKLLTSRSIYDKMRKIYKYAVMTHSYL